MDWTVFKPCTFFAITLWCHQNWQFWSQQIWIKTNLEVGLECIILTQRIMKSLMRILSCDQPKIKTCKIGHITHGTLNRQQSLHSLSDWTCFPICTKYFCMMLKCRNGIRLFISITRLWILFKFKLHVTISTSASRSCATQAWEVFFIQIYGQRHWCKSSEISKCIGGGGNLTESITKLVNKVTISSNTCSLFMEVSSIWFVRFIRKVCLCWFGMM